jgi:hypothetical protein
LTCSPEYKLEHIINNIVENMTLTDAWYVVKTTNPNATPQKYLFGPEFKRTIEKQTADNAERPMMNESCLNSMFPIQKGLVRREIDEIATRTFERIEILSTTINAARTMQNVDAIKVNGKVSSRTPSPKNLNPDVLRENSHIITLASGLALSSQAVTPVSDLSQSSIM